eukprot:CCRYP_013943-RC/>CCRYP_013943-RC protein AED:0.37 eAED:0.37 QI:377/1/1/1/0.5/0.33/3/198/209
MKSINIALSVLVASLAPAAALEQTESNLRGSDELRNVDENSSRNLAYATRAEGWLAAHNSRREKYHQEFQSTYSPLSWSIPLRRQAATFAKSMAANDCTIERPSDMKYGINYNKRVGYSNIPTTEWVVKSWEAKKDEGYPANGSFTQAMWSNSTYLGCADAYNANKKCSISICLYAKAGNCNMNNYPSWEEAITQGPGCGLCPPDVQTC